MYIPEEFFESEVRDGFYVPSFMKRSWAATLEVLDEIAGVCSKHGLKWWLDWGSLIATVRHRGFIPWDDDLDISMMRKDYMLFNRYAQNELPQGYFVNNIYNNHRFDEYHTRVINSTHIQSDEAFLNKHSGFPYTAGVDIFCIDYINPDEEVDKELCRLIYNIGSIATALDPDLYVKDIPEYAGAINDIEAICHYSFNEVEPVRQQINKLCERLMQNTDGTSATNAACMVNHATREGFSGIFPKEYYEELITMPYEFIEVPVPLHYNEILRTLFGNYMKPYRAGGLHDFPYYEKQEKKLTDNGYDIMRKMFDIGSMA